tara:strand:+ start:31 stop:546 length:516 start_codon:yes stop_codon:yes gene_type:complete
MATFTKVSFNNASPRGSGDLRLASIPAKAKHVNDLIDSLEDNPVLTNGLTITSAAHGIIHTNSGAVTQATNHTTAVTLNATSGKITLAAVALAATTNAEFTFTNSALNTTSVVLVSMEDNNTTNNAQLAVSVHSIADGSCKVNLVNPHSSGATSTTASKVHFLVINVAQQS